MITKEIVFHGEELPGFIKPGKLVCKSLIPYGSKLSENHWSNGFEVEPCSWRVIGIDYLLNDTIVFLRFEHEIVGVK